VTKLSCRSNTNAASRGRPSPCSVQLTMNEWRSVLCCVHQCIHDVSNCFPLVRTGDFRGSFMVECCKIRRVRRGLLLARAGFGLADHTPSKTLLRGQVGPPKSHTCIACQAATGARCQCRQSLERDHKRRLLARLAACYRAWPCRPSCKTPISTTLQQMHLRRESARAPVTASSRVMTTQTAATVPADLVLTAAHDRRRWTRFFARERREQHHSQVLTAWRARDSVRLMLRWVGTTPTRLIAEGPSLAVP
jgi:hypothetical protein